MRYFKIFNQNVTRTRPRQELTEDQFYSDLADYCVDKISFLLEEERFDAVLMDLFRKAEAYAACTHGLNAGEYYLYITGDDKTVLDFKRKDI